MVELLEMQKDFMDIIRANVQDYDTLIVPEEFIARRKNKNGFTAELRKQSVPIKFIGGFKKDRVTWSSLFDYNSPIFYGTGDDKYLLDTMRNLFTLLFDSNIIVTHANYDGKFITGETNGYNNTSNSKKSIMFVQLSNSNAKHMVNCKNANHINTFFRKMLYRKEKMVLEFFQTFKLIEDYDALPNFYKDGFINMVSEKWGKKVDEVKAYIKTIPEESKDYHINNRRSTLSSFFKVDDIEQTIEQKKYIKNVEEIQALSETNQKVLGYFNIPWYASDFEEEQIMLIESGMKL